MMHVLVSLDFVLNTYIFGVHNSSAVGAILVVFCLIGSVLLCRKRHIQFSDPLVIAILIINVMIVGQAIRNLIFGMEVNAILSRVQPFYVYFFFLPLITVLNARKRVFTFITLVKFSAVLSALFSIVQYVTQISTSGSTGKVADGYFRVYHPDAYLMAVALLILVSEIFVGGVHAKRSRMNFAFSVILVLGMLTTLHRNLMGATIVSVSMITFVSFFAGIIKKKLRISRFLGTIVVLLFLGVTVANYVGISSEAIAARASTGIDDLLNVEGNFALRIALVLSQFQDTWNDSAIFGKGFDFVPLSLDNYLKFEPFALVADADYGNLAIIFGFSIFIVLSYLYYHLQKRAVHNFKTADDLLSKSIALASIPLPFFFISIGFFAPTSSEPPFLNPLVAMIALTVTLSTRESHELQTKVA